MCNENMMLNHSEIKLILENIYMVTGSNITTFEGVRLQHSRNMIILKSANELTLINTDSMDEQTRVKKMLADYNLRGLDNWGFSDIDAEKLRYDIDSRWFGDLPRSYFFPVNGKIKRLRGALTSAELRALFQPS